MTGRHQEEKTMASKDTICIQGGWQPKSGEPGSLTLSFSKHIFKNT